jgi:probable F420-dependent oxidoreductase
LGHGPLLLPEQGVILCDTIDEARSIGTDTLRAYLSMPNYANNIMRSGFSEDDVAQVSDRLFDALIAWGDEEAIVRRVGEHHAAGADHVCIQVLTDDLRAFPREQWRRIALALSQ